MSTPESSSASKSAGEEVSTEDTRSAADVREQQALRQRGEVPRHIACIMDGNGRWAQCRDQHRSYGHYEGVSSVRDVTETCAHVGVDYLTLYTFSTENWNRPEFEVNALMELLVRTIEKERETLMRNNVQLNTIGDLQELPEPCRDALNRTKEETSVNDGMTLTLALSYSGRWEIIDAVRDIARKVRDGELEPEAVDEALFARYLDTAGMPDPDLIIRTGGEYRLSNFLLWQSAYTELYITDCYWPDFRSDELYEAIRTYQDRDRRFGRVEAPTESTSGDGAVPNDASSDATISSPDVLPSS
ncbi:di-trans,poly-cis-decaprenylcistransferase [Longibacter salinarum]|uniref:Isoprenyl transferase n=2 Tax=Longibacter salinarum TaxID=1850348 RepID=A0A2A8CX65_9BACT|nr:di-trans,poly-cis-decaprenylcistransferase [Longibacter salinarum]